MTKKGLWGEKGSAGKEVRGGSWGHVLPDPWKSREGMERQVGLPFRPKKSQEEPQASV